MSSHAARNGRPLPGTPQSDPIPWSLKKDRGWYEEFDQKSRDLLCLHNLEGRLFSVNPASALVLGYTVEELLRISMRELVAPEFRPQFDEYHNRLLTEGVSAPVVRGAADDVTEQKRAERELSESEERYRSVIAAMAEGVIVVEADGRLAASNPSAECILGVKAEAMQGIVTTRKDWERYTIHEDGSPFLPEDYPSTATLRTGQPQSNVCMGLRRPHSDLRWLLINSQPLYRRGEIKPYAAVVSFSDITERKRAERRLREYEGVVEGLEEMIVVVDRNYRYVLTNRSFLKYRGMEKEQILDRNIDEVLNKESLEAVREKLDECFQGKVGCATRRERSWPATKASSGWWGWPENN
jgi:PAS domain S-box-containing protein